MDAQLRNFQKKRTANFREDETKLLIELWGSPVIQNKLFLTHRKAPVMRILASNMQQRGFYRTPDEIKTRIRNLKCLYHRIKRTMQCGTGIGTVDPDWPHFKAMDAILGKENNNNAKKLDGVTFDDDDDNASLLLEGPKCEDIKQEIEDIDVHDDIDSMATNDSLGSDYDEAPSPPPLKPAPNENMTESQTSKQKSQSFQKQPPDLIYTNSSKKLARLAPNITMTPVPALKMNANNNSGSSSNRSSSSSSNNGFRSNVPSIPLLILNSMPQQNQDKDANNAGTNVTNDKLDIGNRLKELVDIQREQLKLEHKKLNLEKQRLDFQRLVGAQLLTLIPMVGELVKQIVPDARSNGEREETSRKRRRNNNGGKEADNAKYFRSLIQERIKNYIIDDGDDLDDEDISDNEYVVDRNCKNDAD